MTYAFKDTPRERARLRAQCRLGAASIIKNIDTLVEEGKPTIRIGWAFDDGIVTVVLDVATIKQLCAEHLAQQIYDSIVGAQLLDDKPDPSGSIH